MTKQFYYKNIKTNT